MMNRRGFLTTTALTASAMALQGAPGADSHIATNVYPWMTFYRRRKREWDDDIAAGLAEVAKSGVQGFEPIGESPDGVKKLGPLLKKHGLEMRSLYVNSKLHEAIGDVLAIATEAKKLGSHIIVTNPSPIRWGGPENKTDAQLNVQAKALDQLGERIRKEGLTLAYHNHDAELREGGREFHHMLTGTDPENVKLCLDAHWIFRGCGDSQVALFDAVEHYHSRIIELHLRQSTGGIWTEAFAMAGDIDYQRLFDRLADWNLKPHLVLEQAVEERSADTLTAIEAHKLSRENLAKAIS